MNMKMIKYIMMMLFKFTIINQIALWTFLIQTKLYT